MLQAIGEHRKAIELHSKHLELAVSVGDAVSEARAVTNLAEVHDASRNLDAAEHYRRKQLQLARAMGDVAGEGAALCGLAHTLMLAGNDGDVVPQLVEQACAIFHELLDTLGYGGAQFPRLQSGYSRALMLQQRALMATQRADKPPSAEADVALLRSEQSLALGLMLWVGEHAKVWTLTP